MALAALGAAWIVLSGCGLDRRLAQSESESPSARYAAVIDAGSSGSRIHVYRWWPRSGLPRIEEAWRLKVEPGLSAFVGDPPGLRQHLTPLLEFAWDRIENDLPPGDAQARARLQGVDRPRLLLEATGGVRSLEERDRDELLSTARTILEGSPFEVAAVEAIEGGTEALFGWISVNYLMGRLEGNAEAGLRRETVGALDLGGVSTQITFEPSAAPREHRVRLLLGEGAWDLYTYSYRGLGQDDAREAVGAPACFPSGYPLSDGQAGAGDYARCREAVLDLLAGDCKSPPCSRMGVYQPPAEGDFLAFSAFYYAAAFFGLESSFSLRDLETAGVEYCGREWDELATTYAERMTWDSYVPRHCFTAAYLVALLHDGYGLPLDGDRVRPVSEVDGQDVGWTLGSLLFDLADGSLSDG